MLQVRSAIVIPLRLFVRHAGRWLCDLEDRCTAHPNPRHRMNRTNRYLDGTHAASRRSA
jgi:hypothetical protein